jgi:hypothetical protein
MPLDTLQDVVLVLTEPMKPASPVVLKAIAGRPTFAESHKLLPQ